MPSPTAVAIALVRGPLVGTFLAAILYGVTLMQAFFYFRTYERDPRRLKWMVAALVVLDTAHAAMTMWVMDYYLVVHYGDEQALQSATWLSASTYALGLLIDFCVYLYFTWRIWLFTRSKWMVVLMTSLSISRTAISIVATVLSVLKPTWNTFLADFRTLLVVGNMLFILGDTISACAMAYHLTRFKSWAHALPRSRPRRIDVLLNRLLVFAVATGALTSFIDLIALVLTLSNPNSIAFLSAILVQTRLYVNSVLASLNIRNATSRAGQDTVSTPLEHAHAHHDLVHPAISLRFARPSDLSTVSASASAEGDEGEGEDGETVRGRGRVHDSDTNKDITSWQTAHLASRTSPQV